MASKLRPQLPTTVVVTVLQLFPSRLGRLGVTPLWLGYRHSDPLGYLGRAKVTRLLVTKVTKDRTAFGMAFQPHIASSEFRYTNAIPTCQHSTLPDITCIITLGSDESTHIKAPTKYVVINFI
ncbi:hypothetical protein AVEN_83390-1 [Araneus ventricosus]|uniref:Uncharacterized protein n=1 Tax=Araneus ventricosus TaxID=182803 RepID=A0A4Y2HKH4_ARAVE|nr:hypothetical protein AVEN_83390-1 [Araneus ventricosus]